MQISPKIYVPNQLSNKKIASFFFLSFFAIFPSRNESKEGKKKKITDRDRPRIKNQGQTLKELPKISTQKKKKKNHKFKLRSLAHKT